MCLCHFDTARPAPQNDQVLGQPISVEDRLIGVIWHPIEPRDWRQERQRPGGDDKPPSVDDAALGLDPAGTRKPGRALDYSDAEAFKTLNRIVGLDRRDGVVHASEDAFHIDGNVTALDAEIPACAHRGGCMAGR